MLVLSRAETVNIMNTLDAGPYHLRSDDGRQGVVSFTDPDKARSACNIKNLIEATIGSDTKWVVCTSLDNDRSGKGWREVAWQADVVETV